MSESTADERAPIGPGSHVVSWFGPTRPTEGNTVYARPEPDAQAATDALSPRGAAPTAG